MEKKCEYCGKPCLNIEYPSDSHFRFCSQKCYHDSVRTDPIVRFWTKVEKNGPPSDFRPDLGPCWIWTGGFVGSKPPYGQFSLSHTITLRAHRFSFELVKGNIPKGLVLDHLCRVSRCVNPSHLEAVTQRVNNERNPDSVTTKNRLKTQCVHGHRFTPENTYQNGLKGRHCKRCIQLHKLAHKERNNGG